MDLLVSGAERPPSPWLRWLGRLPVRAVLPALVLVLVAALLGIEPVRRADRAAADVSGVGLLLVVERTRRAGDGSAYGFARLEVTDPAGRPVALTGVEVDVPGLRLGPRGPRLRELRPAPTVVLGLRLAVEDCGDLRLPGRVRAVLSRPGHPGMSVSAAVHGEAARALRAACGLP